MPRPKPTFKKRKGFHGKRPYEVAAQEIQTSPPEVEQVEPEPLPSTSTEDAVSISSSSSKISRHLEDYEVYSSNSAFDLVDVDALNHALSPLVSCKECGGNIQLFVEKRVGLASTIRISCENCDIVGKVRNSSTQEYEVGGKYFCLFALYYVDFHAKLNLS